LSPSTPCKLFDARKSWLLACIAPQPPPQRIQRHLVWHTAARGVAPSSRRWCNHHGASGLPSAAYALPQPSQDPHCTVASEQSPRTQAQGSAESAVRGQSAAINGIWNQQRPSLYPGRKRRTM